MGSVRGRENWKWRRKRIEKGERSKGRMVREGGGRAEGGE